MPCTLTYTHMIDLTVADREENTNATLGEKNDEIVQKLYTLKKKKNNQTDLFLLSFGFVA